MPVFAEAAMKASCCSTARDHSRSSRSPPTLIPNTSRNTAGNSSRSNTRFESTEGPISDSVRERSVTIRSSIGPLHDERAHER